MKQRIEVIWNETIDDVEERKPRDADELVDLRRRRQSLEDITLPKGFRLITPSPRQFWLDSQATWGFELGWAPVDAKGRRKPEDQYRFIARYYPLVPDTIQMTWALADFQKELEWRTSVHVSTRVRTNVHTEIGWKGALLRAAS